MAESLKTLMLETCAVIVWMTDEWYSVDRKGRPGDQNAFTPNLIQADTRTVFCFQRRNNLWWHTTGSWSIVDIQFFQVRTTQHKTISGHGANCLYFGRISFRNQLALWYYGLDTDTLSMAHHRLSSHVSSAFRQWWHMTTWHTRRDALLRTRVSRAAVLDNFSATCFARSLFPHNMAFIHTTMTYWRYICELRDYNTSGKTFTFIPTRNERYI